MEQYSDAELLELKEEYKRFLLAYDQRVLPFQWIDEPLGYGWLQDTPQTPSPKKKDFWSV